MCPLICIHSDRFLLIAPHPHNGFSQFSIVIFFILNFFFGHTVKAVATKGRQEPFYCHLIPRQPLAVTTPKWPACTTKWGMCTIPWGTMTGLWSATRRRWRSGPFEGPTFPRGGGSSAHLNGSPAAATAAPEG